MLSFKKEAHIKAKVNVHDVSWRNACQYHHEEGQKNFLRQGFWDFFGQTKAKKIPKTGRMPKNPG